MPFSVQKIKPWNKICMYIQLWNKTEKEEKLWHFESVSWDLGIVLAVKENLQSKLDISLSFVFLRDLIFRNSCCNNLKLSPLV